MRAELYATVAQVLPVLVLALALQLRSIERTLAKLEDLDRKASEAFEPARKRISEWLDELNRTGSTSVPFSTRSLYEVAHDEFWIAYAMLAQRERFRVMPVRGALLLAGVGELLALLGLCLRNPPWPLGLAAALATATVAFVLGLILWRLLAGKGLPTPTSDVYEQLFKESELRLKEGERTFNDLRAMVADAHDR